MPPAQDSRPVLRAYLALIVLLAALCAVLFGLWRLLHSLGSVPAAAVITASATVLISVFSLIYSKSWEQRRGIQEAHRQDKRRVYEQFMDFWFRYFTAAMLGDDPPTESEAQRFMAEFAHELILWGSDDFVAEYARFRSIAGQAAGEDAQSKPAAIFAFEDLLYSLRRDLGHSNKNLSRGDLYRLWINDIDTLFPRTGSGS